MVKRKAKDLEVGVTIDEPRRSSRRVSKVNEAAAPEVKLQKPTSIPKEAKKAEAPKKKSTKPISIPKEAKKPKKLVKEADPTFNGKDEESPYSPTEITKTVPPNIKKLPTSNSASRQYWLMKAEPESRLEKGHDVKFSIDDLASRTEPEPWDGIRAYPARNNLRAMKKGDLAFFYHSSCKVPAIVGIMEITQEHSPDLSAHDPAAPYHDPSSKPEDPKWSLVHVTFRQKLDTPITLKDLRGFQAEKGSPLENMQMLKLTRLSVSRVSTEEWEFLTAIMEKNGDKLQA